MFVSCHRTAYTGCVNYGSDKVGIMRYYEGFPVININYGYRVVFSSLAASGRRKTPIIVRCDEKQGGVSAG